MVKVTEKRERGRPTKYPWEKWLTSPKFTIRSNSYTANQTSMCVMIRQNARALGVQISVFPQENGSIKIESAGPLKKKAKPRLAKVS